MCGFFLFTWFEPSIQFNSIVYIIQSVRQSAHVTRYHIYARRRRRRACNITRAIIVHSFDTRHFTSLCVQCVDRPLDVQVYGELKQWIECDTLAEQILLITEGILSFSSTLFFSLSFVPLPLSATIIYIFSWYKSREKRVSHQSNWKSKSNYDERRNNVAVTESCFIIFPTFVTGLYAIHVMIIITKIIFFSCVRIVSGHMCEWSTVGTFDLSFECCKCVCVCGVGLLKFYSWRDPHHVHVHGCGGHTDGSADDIYVKWICLLYGVRKLTAILTYGDCRPPISIWHVQHIGLLCCFTIFLISPFLHFSFLPTWAETTILQTWPF